MPALAEKARITVDSLIAQRHEPRTYEEKVRHALDLVQMHLEEENPERIDECIRLYTEDAEWEAPARLVNYKGRETIKKMYLKVFSGVEDFVFTPMERWATPDRVFDDSFATFRIVGDAFENCPLPIGTKVRMRLIHNFHIQDGLISKEIGYEVWRRAG
jgi:ketosteroid isomerase-like protein